MAEVLRERTDELAARNSEFGERIEHQSATIDVLGVINFPPVRAGRGHALTLDGGGSGRG